VSRQKEVAKAAKSNVFNNWLTTPGASGPLSSPVFVAGQRDWSARNRQCRDMHRCERSRSIFHGQHTLSRHAYEWHSLEHVQCLHLSTPSTLRLVVPTRRLQACRTLLLQRDDAQTTRQGAPGCFFQGSDVPSWYRLGTLTLCSLCRASQDGPGSSSWPNFFGAGPATRKHNRPGGWISGVSSLCITRGKELIYFFCSARLRNMYGTSGPSIIGSFSFSHSLSTMLSFSIILPSPFVTLT